MKHKLKNIYTTLKPQRQSNTKRKDNQVDHSNSDKKTTQTSTSTTGNINNTDTVADMAKIKALNIQPVPNPTKLQTVASKSTSFSGSSSTSIPIYDPQKVKADKSNSISFSEPVSPLRLKQMPATKKLQVVTSEYISYSKPVSPTTPQTPDLPKNTKHSPWLSVTLNKNSDINSVKTGRTSGPRLSLKEKLEIKQKLDNKKNTSLKGRYYDFFKIEIKRLAEITFSCSTTLLNDLESSNTVADRAIQRAFKVAAVLSLGGTKFIETPYIIPKLYKSFYGINLNKLKSCSASYPKTRAHWQTFKKVIPLSLKLTLQSIYSPAYFLISTSNIFICIAMDKIGFERYKFLPVVGKKTTLSYMNIAKSKKLKSVSHRVVSTLKQQVA